MKELYDAIMLISQYDRCKSINEIADRFAKYSKQDIPNEAIEEYCFTGLSNVDFLTSDYLNKYGIMNLLQYESINSAKYQGNEGVYENGVSK